MGSRYIVPAAKKKDSILDGYKRLNSVSDVSMEGQRHVSPE